ncbi:diacylglycerol kinase family protein [Arthrobacter sp. H5]|uniref:diacylglycerol kinase family protein n=1 Tax=Arthrobacter sp. H5 TaxID=1267973 RepID=UPI0004BC75EC|nr:diacylglycerol kinase family protein [Arthrobacter sp. H5]
MAVNPVAGSGYAAGAGATAASQLSAAGHTVEWIVGESWEVLRQRVEAAVRGGADALVVVGGDGMVHLGANVLAERPVPLGIVAAGTGNDVARTLGLPVRRPADAAQVILKGLRTGARPMDLGRISSGSGSPVWFAGACSAGFDAVVNARANARSWPKGRSRYTLAVLRELAVFKPLNYRLAVDGRAENTSAMLVCVANAQSIGGGMRIVPTAEYDDGALDLFVVSPLSRWRLVMLLPLVFSGRHVGHPAVRLERAQSVSIDVPGITLFADGEPVGVGPVGIDVVPGALHVLA